MEKEIFVRWLGAFRKSSGSLHSSLEWELSNTREIACERVLGQSLVHANIGLKVKSSAIIKNFNGDCWSEVVDGKLVKTRNPKEAFSKHLESWACPEFQAIVICKRKQITAKSLKTVRFFAKEYQIPVIELETRRVVPISKMEQWIEKKEVQ